MEKIINNLADVLEQEAGVYDDLLKLSKDKTRIVVDGKVHELEAIVKLEQALVIQMRKLESAREELVLELADAFGIKPEDLTVSEIVKHIDDKEAVRLKRCQDSLINTINELKINNDLNSKLIKNALDFVEFSINLISNAGTPENSYSSTGQVSRGKGRSFFDVKL